MYIASHSPVAAERLVIEALEVSETLAEFPERGRLVPEVNDSNCRELLVAKHRLVYRITAGRVTVVGFVHAARDFRPWWTPAAELTIVRPHLHRPAVRLSFVS